MSASASLVPTGGSRSAGMHNMARKASSTVQHRCKFPQQAGEAAFTHASVSEEPLAKGERKESLLHCYCKCEKKTEFGGACSMKLVLTLT